MNIYVKCIIIFLFVVSGILSILLIPKEYRSDIILLVSATIVLWYTYETREIKKANIESMKILKEQLIKTQRPIVGHQISNEGNALDTQFKIKNQSDYPVAALVNLNIKLANEPVLEVWPCYSGLEFWNLQYQETMQGHFSIIKLFHLAGYLKDEEYEGWKNLDIATFREKIVMLLPVVQPETRLIPKLTMDIEVYCRNELGLEVFYPPMHYVFNFARAIWIPSLTALKPYWDYYKRPSWVDEKLFS